MKLDRSRLTPPAAPTGLLHENAVLPRGRSITDVKEHNLHAILSTLLRCGPTSRVDMARMTGLSSTTITNLVTVLLEQGIVEEAGKEPAAADARSERQGAGRPPTLIRIIPHARCAVGIHIGVDTVHVGVTDLFGGLQAYRMAQQPDAASGAGAASAEQILRMAAEMADAALEESGGCRDCLVGIGVGASGLTDPRTGINVLAPSLGWRNVPVRDILTEITGRPVMVDNNVRAMALAESMFGAGRDVNMLAFVYSRVGVGAGFVIGGEPYRGTQYGAGEIGHTTVIPAGGAPCRCGNSGCLETLVSEGEIVRQAGVLASRAPGSVLAQALSAERSIDAVFDAARAGDREALALLDERASHLGTTLANLVNLMNPDMIILGGLFAAGADLMLPRIEETMRRRSFAGLGERVTLAVTTFGRKVGVIGAAALALDAFFYRQGTQP